jgi:MFS family permease
LTAAEPATDSISVAGVAAGLAVGGCLTWNVSNVGAVADPLADHYGVSVAAIGLLTTALFVTHLAVQLPSGRGADRFGSQRVALLAIAAGVIGNAVLLLDAGFELALVGRAIVGVGSGAAFVSGLDLVRAGRGGAALQGLYGGATMAGGGLALMIVPPLTDATSWRAPFWSGALLALLAVPPTLAARGLPRIGHAGAWVLRDRDLLPLGVLQAATFGLAVVAGNWAVPLLERQGASSTAAGLAGGLILFVGIATRPAGGILAGRTSGRLLVGAALVGTSAGALLLALSVVRGVRTRSVRARADGRAPVRRDLRGGAAPAPGRARRRDRARERVRRAHDPGRNATRRAHLRAAERGPCRLRGHRRSRRCRVDTASHGPPRGSIIVLSYRAKENPRWH